MAEDELTEEAFDMFLDTIKQLSEYVDEVSCITHTGHLYELYSRTPITGPWPISWGSMSNRTRLYLVTIILVSGSLHPLVETLQTPFQDAMQGSNNFEVIDDLSSGFSSRANEFFGSEEGALSPNKMFSNPFSPVVLQKSERVERQMVTFEFSV